MAHMERGMCLKCGDGSEATAVSSQLTVKHRGRKSAWSWRKEEERKRRKEEKKRRKGRAGEWRGQAATEEKVFEKKPPHKAKMGCGPAPQQDEDRSGACFYEAAEPQNVRDGETAKEEKVENLH